MAPLVEKLGGVDQKLRKRFLAELVFGFWIRSTDRAASSKLLMVNECRCVR